jgi:hypothetical protein
MKKKNYQYVVFLVVTILVSLFLSFLFGCNQNEAFDNNQNTKDVKLTIQDDEKGMYTAVIIEPREHKALGFVLNNFLENLDERWNIIVFHGNKNKEYVENIINTSLEKYKNRISLIDLKVDNLGSLHEYSSVLLDRKFYDNIPTEMFLIFQTDTVICSKYKDMIYDFMDYDYVGAPVRGHSPWNWEDGEVGNGGLSLRRKSKMLEMLDKCSHQLENHDKSTYEDNFYAFPCENIKSFNKPSVEKAKNFAIEKIESDKSFGLHKAYSYLDKTKICEWCPEINTIHELNT